MNGDPAVPRFVRGAAGAPGAFLRIGEGALGGKALGLAGIRDVLSRAIRADAYPGIVEVGIPALAVIGAAAYEAFVRRNGLTAEAVGSESDERIAIRFQRGELPVEIVGDLRALVEEVRSPLAVRSSAVLEDALGNPFAGLYRTKMTPNRHRDADRRFRELASAVKLVWASSLFEGPRSCRVPGSREEMAVIVQHVVGVRFGNRFYPQVSGVARSLNVFPQPPARRETGVVQLALGLGKTIVDGGEAWTYSPAHPKAPPPFASNADLVRRTQTRFWSVWMAEPATYDPTLETEFLVHGSLEDADSDGSLELVASTWSAESDRLVPGAHGAGARAVTFAPILGLGRIGLNALIRDLLSACEDAVGEPVEMEFAIAIESGRTPAARFGFLQVRPMLGVAETVTVTEAELDAAGVVVASRSALGSGEERLADIVYVPPARFERGRSRDIAAEIGSLNARLAETGRGYVLLGFGRWGSADPWLGIPVGWPQIRGARVVVECGLADFRIEPSQGAHFFHNLASQRVSYLTVPYGDRPGVDWNWLDAQPAAFETEHVRHVGLGEPLTVRVDGRSGRAVVVRAGA